MLTAGYLPDPNIQVLVSFVLDCPLRRPPIINAFNTLFLVKSFLYRCYALRLLEPTVYWLISICGRLH